VNQWRILVQGKRKKDPEIAVIRQILEDLIDAAEVYRERLEGELEAARAEQEPYEHLIRSLNSQIGSVRNLEMSLDEQIWPQIVRLAHGSSYVEHTRTRDYF
jgi:hypothetical protein